VNVSDCENYTAGNCPDNVKQNGECPKCGDNVNSSKAENYTVVCACYPGQMGINCAVADGIAKGLIAGLTTAAIVGIILAALAAAACAGGGGFAVSNAVSQDKGGGVFNNPLYEGGSSSGVNPLSDG
jgi:tetrahydromethanopterin S-methyltransferase subunit E